jgi:hypothetical protein
MSVVDPIPMFVVCATSVASASTSLQEASLQGFLITELLPAQGPGLGSDLLVLSLGGCA